MGKNVQNKGQKCPHTKQELGKIWLLSQPKRGRFHPPGHYPPTFPLCSVQAWSGGVLLCIRHQRKYLTTPLLNIIKTPE